MMTDFCQVVDFEVSVEVSVQCSDTNTLRAIRLNGGETRSSRLRFATLEQYQFYQKIELLRKKSKKGKKSCFKKSCIMKKRMG